ncbi:helicase [Plasmodium vivax Brazil I]|uniref:Helicase n=1 Tax=Plasmodium vivax (strain Brazil I) TaxID=1033975 RepID=A0A0J9VMP9_PLAV1|nr:helicase [Plasmodium vivax Brazil I]
MKKADGDSRQHTNVAASGEKPPCGGEKGASFCEAHMEGMALDISNEHVTGDAIFSKEDNMGRGGETPTLGVLQDGDAFELTSPLPLHKSDNESTGGSERKEPEGEMAHEGEIDHEEYLYVSEHLRIKKDKQIFVSNALNDYINEHLSFFSSCEEKFFGNKNGEAERFMEIGLNLKYLRYRDRQKRRKRRLASGGGAASAASATVTPAATTATPTATTASSDSSSLFSNSSSGESPCTSDEDILEQLHFDKESLRRMKRLEKSKNAYFKYLSDLCIQHDVMSRFTLPYFERVKRAIRKFPAKHKWKRDRCEASIQTMQVFLENEENVKRIELSQRRLRSDVVNSMFGFHIISDAHPMKVPIKGVNRLGAREAASGTTPWGATTLGSATLGGATSGTATLGTAPHACNPFAQKSWQSTKRAGTAKQSGGGSHGEEGARRRRRPGATKGNPHKGGGHLGESGYRESGYQESGYQESGYGASTYRESTYRVRGQGGGNPGTKNYLDEHIKKVHRNSRLHNKVGTLKEYTLLSNWDELRRHHHAVRVAADQRRSNAQMLANLCYEQMKLLEKKRKLIIEREEKERLRLLKENDMDAYINLLRNTKNKRLQELLDVTEEFLTSMSSCVLRQKKDSAFGVAPLGDPSSVGSNEMDSTYHSKGANVVMKSNYQDAREKYLLVSHSVKEKVVQPSILIGGTLMKYQLEGLEWLISLYNNNLHGILADEMGLGKTIQTISLFAYLKEFKWGGLSNGKSAPSSGRHKQPKNLIIVPLSTLPNWTSEFQAWCPSLKVITYRGTKCERRGLAKQMLESEYDICLTTFDFAIKEKALLIKIFWTYIVVDEGHRMKNSKSRFHIILKDFKSKQRVLLTGTPLQNNLSELWSLLNFLLPKIFSSCEDFERWFIRPLHNDKDLPDVTITEEEQLLIINRLHSVLLPFMLRRVKKDVLKSLPKRYEYNVHVDLSLHQKMLYRQIEMKGFTQINRNDGSISNKSCQNMVMQLRKVVNHPYLFLQEYNIDEYLIKCSGKFEVLDRMLPKLLRFRHKTLIFSQMTKLMDVLCDYLDFRGHRFLRLDGNSSLHERRRIIEQFNRVDGGSGEAGGAADGSCAGDNPLHLADSPLGEPNGGHDETMIFMLSTRSGSLGLNLQTADTVIIFDSDFNPHQDIQAMCRCHRIGQKNVVKVFRFITLSGVEELIFQRAQDKLTINDKVIQAGLFNKIYSDEDRRNKLKSIFQRSQKGQVTVQSTNPLLLNYYMQRSDAELEHFLKFDERYFGEELYAHLQTLNRERPDEAQFTYMREDMSGDEGGAGKLGSGTLPCDEPPTDEPPTDEPPTDEPPTDEPPTDEPPTDEPPTDEPPTNEPPTNEPLPDNPPPEEPRGGDAPSWAEERSAILKEENQNEIEKVLIKSKKLVNGDELPSYLFYDDTDDGPPVEFKRTRRQINVHLMDQENLSNVEFLQLIDSGGEEAAEGVEAEEEPEKEAEKDAQVIEKANGEEPNADPLNDDPLNADPLSAAPLGPQQKSSPYNFRRSGGTERTYNTRNGRASEGSSASPQRGKRKSRSPGEVRLNEDKRKRRSRG